MPNIYDKSFAKTLIFGYFFSKLSYTKVGYLLKWIFFHLKRNNMRKLFYLFLCLFSAMFFFATESFSAEGEETPVKGVFLKKASSFGAKPQIRIDDSLLDTDGVSSKQFTMSVRVWIDEIPQEQLNFMNMPLFGISVKDVCGRTNMADIVLEQGAYNVNMNKLAGVEQKGDNHNKVSARMNEWVFLTLVVNDEEQWAKLYCDGVETSYLDYSSYGNIFRVGEESVFYCSNSKGYSSLNIRFDDLKIVDTVLDEEQIQDLKYAYLSETLPSYIKGYYTFDETTGTVNEYPNLAGNNVVAQVVEGTTIDSNGNGYAPKLSQTDAMCDGWTPVYQDKETFKVNVTIEGEGTVVLKDYDGKEYQSGAAFLKDSTVFVIANPGEDYIVSEIYVDETKQTDIENVSFKITKATEVKVVFVLKGSKVNVADENMVGGTYICVDPITDTEYPKDATGKFYSIPYHSQVKVKATANAEEGYRLKSITVSNGEDTQELELSDPVFTIENDEYEINVVFVARYSLNFRVDGEGGSILVKVNGENAVSGKMYDAGTEIEVTVKPDNNKKLAELTVNALPVSVVDNVYTMALESNTDIIATFTDITGLESIAGENVYYDSVSKILYTGTQSVIKVYSLNGSLIKEIVGNMIDMNQIDANQCVVTVVCNGKSSAFKIIK